MRQLPDRYFLKAGTAGAVALTTVPLLAGEGHAQSVLGEENRQAGVPDARGELQVLWARQSETTCLATGEASRSGARSRHVAIGGRPRSRERLESGKSAHAGTRKRSRFRMLDEAGRDEGRTVSSRYDVHERPGTLRNGLVGGRAITRRDLDGQARSQCAASLLLRVSQRRPRATIPEFLAHRAACWKTHPASTR